MKKLTDKELAAANKLGQKIGISVDIYTPASLRMQAKEYRAKAEIIDKIIAIIAPPTIPKPEA